MADYAWPGAPLFTVAQSSLVLVPNTRTFTSPYSGAQQTVDLLGERWKWSIAVPGATRAIGRQRQAFLNALRGASKTVALYDLALSSPTGTLSGSPTTSGAISQGATTLNIACTTGQTLKAGDKIGVSGMLFEVAADAVSSAVVVVTPALDRVVI